MFDEFLLVEHDMFVDSTFAGTAWEGVEGFSVSVVLGRIGAAIHRIHGHWWNDPATGQPRERNVGEMLMLSVSELAEAMEGHRKGLNDDHLPDRPMIEVEIADCMIRLFDLAAGLGLDLGGALVEKLYYNIHRADHKPENRLKPGGKKY